MLAGGLSTRMGRDKALLRWNNGSLVEQLAKPVKEAAGSVAIIGDPSRYAQLGFDCFPDVRSGLGPLAGLETALETRRGDLNLVLACDMPGVDTAWLRRLIDQADECKAPCVATRDASGVVHPLCAVYRSDCLPIIQRALDEGKLRLQDLLVEVGAIMADTAQILSNVNTPEEWTAWRRREYTNQA